MRQTVKHLPKPAKGHATCPWCEATLGTIVALLDHVDTHHLPPAEAA
jgi:hypothetical protein